MRNVILLLITLGLSIALGGCSDDTPYSPAPPLTLKGEYSGIYTFQQGEFSKQMYVTWRFSDSAFQMRGIDTLGMESHCCDFDGHYSLNDGVTFKVTHHFYILCPYIYEPSGIFEYTRYYIYLNMTQYDEERDVTKTFKLYKDEG